MKILHKCANCGERTYVKVPARILHDCPICGAQPSVDYSAEYWSIGCERGEGCTAEQFSSEDPFWCMDLWNEYAEEELEICRFTIELPPVTKKNHSEIRYNRRRNTHYIAPSMAYERYASAAGMFVPWPERLGLEGPITEPVNVEAHYYMATKRTVDIANLHSALHDVLTEAHLLADDNRDIIAGTDGSEVLYDKARPRTEVIITRRRGYEQWRPGGSRK